MVSALLDTAVTSPALVERQYFDLIIIIPLEEELTEFMEVFTAREDRCTPTQFRYVVTAGDSPIKILVVQQEAMGKTSAARAASDILEEFDAGVLICLGIAGGLSNDIRLGDVCYSGTIIDVYDNSKTSDGAEGELEVEFSPTHHETLREITAAFNFIRTIPELRESYEAWQKEREAFAKSIVPEAVLSREGREEILGKPNTRNGTIVCAAVSKSAAYNNKLRAIDRKILAVETESGGVFEGAKAWNCEAITIRGICDYADSKKNELESNTSGAVRRLAAANAAAFLRLQLQNKRFLNVLARLRHKRDEIGTGISQPAPLPITDISSVVSAAGAEIDAKLRELSPEFRLQPQGYRLPIPRVRAVDFNNGIANVKESTPVEVRDALRDRDAILLNVPRTYPDHSLPWVLADDLLKSELAGRQVLPIVLDGKLIRPPRSGLAQLTKLHSLELLKSIQGAILVFIIDDVPFASKTRLNFLIEDVKAQIGCKFVFLTRDERNLVAESEFVGKLAADMFSVCDVSFREIAHFIQKNFSMSGTEAEVIALRLRETFNEFNLSAHPTYFAGIPRETLSALLQANRRAELIQLAVDGFLTFMVAEDTADVALSRTTRSRFLRKLAVSLKVEKQSYTLERLIAFTREFSIKYDFEIDPLTFIHSFIDKGILHFEAELVIFSLPFIESYLLAVELRENENLAISYFQLDDLSFDLATFDLYAEIGASPVLVRNLLARLEQCMRDLRLPDPTKHILLTDEIRPSLGGKPDRLRTLQEQLARATEDVRANRGDKDRKQRLLDIADRVREKAAQQTEQISSGEANKPEDRAQAQQARLNEQSFAGLNRAVCTWAVGTIALGSGAEHLDAAVKQKLAKVLIELAAVIVDSWTQIYVTVDFDVIRNELTKPEVISAFETERGKGEDVKRLVENLVSVLEFSFVSEPFRRILNHLCEQARDRVLATKAVPAHMET